MNPTDKTKGRKAQVEIQFNWIFILIVGAIILAFFVTIAMRQKSAAEQETNIGFFTNFEKALGGVGAVQGKTLLFDVPNMELRYDCTSGCDCAAYSGLTRAKASAMFRMKDKIIFSPDHLKGNNLLVMSKDWSYPFRIVNFLFMTSPEVKYMIEDTDYGNELWGDLPPVFIKVYQKDTKAFDKSSPFDPIKIKEITGITGNYKVKFVFTETDPESITLPNALKSLPDSDVSAIKIVKGTANSPEKAIFYQKNSTLKFRKKGEAYLFGEATAIAAIFSEDINSYNCMMKSAFKTFNMVSKVYNEKLKLYRDELFSDTICTTNSDCKERELCIDVDATHKRCQHQCSINYDDKYVSLLVDNTENFDFSQPQQAQSILSNAKSISQQNDNAIRYSCPHLY